LWRLQRVCSGLVVVSRDLLTLSGVTVDVHAVEEWITAAITPPLTLGERPCAPPPGAGRPLLSGWEDDWVEQPRERLRLLQLQAFESLAGRLLSAGRPAEALPHAIAVMQAAPLRESANQLMIEIHLRQGNVNEAVRHYERYRALTRSELGVEPGLGITSLLGRFLPVAAAGTRP
jgi:two-component SAPR family response regulator